MNGCPHPFPFALPQSPLILDCAPASPPSPPSFPPCHSFFFSLTSSPPALPSLSIYLSVSPPNVFIVAVHGTQHAVAVWPCNRASSLLRLLSEARSRERLNERLTPLRRGSIRLHSVLRGRSTAAFSAWCSRAGLPRPSRVQTPAASFSRMTSSFPPPLMCFSIFVLIFIRRSPPSVLRIFLAVHSPAVRARSPFDVPLPSYICVCFFFRNALLLIFRKHICICNAYK